LYPAQRSHCEAGSAFAARRQASVAGLRRRILANLSVIWGNDLYRGLLHQQLCISAFIRGKYDFTSQFIWWKYK